MTGFGAGRGEAAGEALTVELRAVNGKFCEVKPRLPRELSALETELVKTVKARVSRGVVDVFVRRESASGRGLLPQIDLALAAAYAKALRELKDELGLAGEPSVHDVAQLEGVLSLGEAAADVAAMGAPLQSALLAAPDALDQMPRRGGEARARQLTARPSTPEQGTPASRRKWWISRPSSSACGSRSRMSNSKARTSKSKPLLLILSAPSGTGKTTLARRLVAANPGAIFSVSYTTRGPRGGERDGVDYHFVSEERFQQMIAGGEFVEWAHVHGHHYGTPKSVIAEAAARGALAVFDIDVQGGESIKKQHPEAVRALVLPPSLAELERRQRARPTEDQATPQPRPQRAPLESPRAPPPGSENSGGDEGHAGH